MLEFWKQSAMDAAASGTVPLPFLFLGMAIALMLILLLYPLIIRPLRAALKSTDKKKDPPCGKTHRNKKNQMSLRRITCDTVYRRQWKRLYKSAHRASPAPADGERSLET